MKKKVIASKNLPMRTPFWTYIVLWLLMDRLNAPEWLFGAFWMIVIFSFIGWLKIRLKDEEEIDIFKGGLDGKS